MKKITLAKSIAQNSKYLYLLSYMLFVLSGNVLAQNTCTVSGAGTPEINGDYFWDGMWVNMFGNPVYAHLDFPFFMHADPDGFWVINDNPDEIFAGTIFYSAFDGGNVEIPPGEDWFPEMGDFPEPTTSCGGGGGGGGGGGTPPIEIGCWDVISIELGHSLGVKADGTLWAWGDASYGKLGNGNNSGDVLVATQIGTDTDWAKISAGQHHSIGIKTDGTLWAWGNASNGRLGNGSSSGDILVPTQIGTDTDWAKISAGRNFSVAIKTDGTLWTWGNDSDGQLGNGFIPNDDILVPTQVGTDTDWTKISAGQRHCMGIRTDETLWAWGTEQNGRLGNGSTWFSAYVPEQIGTANWDAVSAGNGHTMGLQTDGTLWTWGAGHNGQLGNGSNTPTISVPIQIGTDTDWAKISAGDSHSTAIKTNGTLWTWGKADNGRLGNGSNSGDVLVPTQIGTDTDWEATFAADEHSMAIKTGGKRLAWGGAQYGRLGNDTNSGDITEPYSPLQIHLPPKGVYQTISATSIADHEDWTYYYNNVDEGLIFAINWAPDGSLHPTNEAARDNSSVTIGVLDFPAFSEFNGDGSFLMGRYWNVNTNGYNFNEPVNIRYYYDPTEISDIETEAASYASVFGSPVRELQWFKMNNVYDPFNDNNPTFDPDIYLTPSLVSDNCGKSFAQFDEITSFSGGAAGVGVGDAFPDSPIEVPPCSASSQPPTAAGTYVGAEVTVDMNGYSHYCDGNGNLLLSIKTPAGITIPPSAVKVKVGATAATYYDQYCGGTRSGGCFVRSAVGNALINRFWDIDKSQVTGGTISSSNSLDVVFYFTYADFIALNTEMANNGQSTLSSLAALQAYVVKNTATLPDFPSPSDIGNYRKVYRLSNSSSASTTKWKLGNPTSDIYSMEMKVIRIDNGGGLGKFY